MDISKRVLLDFNHSKILRPPTRVHIMSYKLTKTALRSLKQVINSTLGRDLP